MKTKDPGPQGNRATQATQGRPRGHKAGVSSDWDYSSHESIVCTPARAYAIRRCKRVERDQMTMAGRSYHGALLGKKYVYRRYVGQVKYPNSAETGHALQFDVTDVYIR
jgi:hypothetical protein